MYEFLVQNWQFISTAILTIIAIVIALLKKRPVKEVIDDGLISKLMEFINEAEAKFKCGSDKMDYVISRFKERYPLTYQKLEGDLSETPWYSSSHSADDSIRQAVEFVLTTPHKKEKGGE